LGFANPLIYQIGQGTSYHQDFFDITDGSTNLYYAAKAGYDNATGWGSFNGANLIKALTSMTPIVPPPSAPQNLKATAGNASVSLSWTAAALATKYTIFRGVASGTGSLSAITTVTTNSYTDANLSNGTTYYYAVKAVNGSVNSDFSAVVSAQPTLPPLAIIVGPYLSLSANRTSATISWTTNAAASSTIVYGTNATNLNQTASSATLSVSHALALSSLTRGATYYLQIKSANASGSVASPIYYFTNR
jgi:fibronectin type 3 domain-containing protein